MNKQLCAILALLLVVAPLPVSAEEHPEYVTQDGIVYRYLPQTDSVNVYEITEVLDTRISSVTIPAQIDGVDVLCTTNVFKDCVSLESITVEENSRYLYDIDGVLFSISPSNPEIHNLVVYPGAKPGTEYTVPAGISLLDSNSAFRNCLYLARVNLPDGITPICSLFSICPNLEEINGTVELHGELPSDGMPLRTLSLGGRMDGFELGIYPELESLAVDEQTVSYGYFRISGTKLRELRIPQIVGDKFTQFEYLCESDEAYQKSYPSPEAVYDKVEQQYGAAVLLSDCPELESIILPYGAVRAGVTVKNCPKLQSILIEPRDDVYTLLKEAYTEAGQGLDALDHAKYEGFLKIVNCPRLTKVENPYPRLSIAQMAEESSDAPVFYGDLDGNETIDLLDVIALNKSLLGLQQLEASEQKAADVNADGHVDSSDSLLILRYMVHLEYSLGA